MTDANDVRDAVIQQLRDKEAALETTARICSYVGGRWTKISDELAAMKSGIEWVADTMSCVDFTESDEEVDL